MTCDIYFIHHIRGFARRSDNVRWQTHAILVIYVCRDPEWEVLVEHDNKEMEKFFLKYRFLCLEC